MLRTTSLILFVVAVLIPLYSCESYKLKHKRDISIPGVSKPTHRDVIIPNWNPHARTRPWQTIGVKTRNRRSEEMFASQEGVYRSPISVESLASHETVFRRPRSVGPIESQETVLRSPRSVESLASQETVLRSTRSADSLASHETVFRSPRSVESLASHQTVL
ncbi:jg11823 [Pararge aegeria aegeria]|nr:jg11823 [Pararge aegeria aegeria]